MAKKSDISVTPSSGNVFADLGFAEPEEELARAQLAAFALQGYGARLVGEIGLGFHKLIELARASGGEPALLLLDEPAVGLTSSAEATSPRHCVVTNV